jgi:hypothetical protein
MAELFRAGDRPIGSWTAMSLLSPEPAAVHFASLVPATAEERISLLGAVSPFAAAIPPAEQSVARRILQVPRLELDAGPWAVPARDEWGKRATAMVLLRGVLVRELALGGRSAAELFGAGDVIDPWSRPSGALPFAIRWSALVPATIAVLDARFQVAAHRWPGLSAVLRAGRGARAERLAGRTALLQLPRVEQRVLALMWEWADRFGRVCPDGIVFSLPVTHELLGRLVAARRPTVSLALAGLAEAGSLRRREHGDWVLSPTSDGAF